MIVRHVIYDLNGFADALPGLIAEVQSIMYYLYPHDDGLTVEFRSYSELSRHRTNKSLWSFRNFFWKTGASTYGALVTRLIPFHRSRYVMIDGFYRALALVLSRLLRSRWTVATDQIIRYPEHKKITSDGAVMTLDPVSTGAEGWNDFLHAYNEFCSEHNGVPLFNQSKWLTRKQVRKAFGVRVKSFWRYKTAFDSDGRFTNTYFHGLFAPNEKYRPDNRGRNAAFRPTPPSPRTSQCQEVKGDSLCKHNA